MDTWIWLIIGYLVVMFLSAPVIHAVQDYKWEHYTGDDRWKGRNHFMRFDTPTGTWAMAAFWPLLIPVILVFTLAPIYNFLYSKATWAVKEVTDPKENV